MNPLRISANLYALCVKSSQPGIKSGHSNAKSAEKRREEKYSENLCALLNLKAARIGRGPAYGAALHSAHSRIAEAVPSIVGSFEE